MLSDEVSIGSGSDWVTVLAISTVAGLETRSLPLPVLTPSSRKKESEWTGA
jgi:hypothetical protein